MIEYNVKVHNDRVMWYYKDELHREDGPAVEYASGTKYWYLNGELHREDGPAIEWASGTKEWYHKGKLHREDGPAIESANGFKEWYRDGELHREDGPAVERYGQKWWWLNGIQVSEEEHARKARSIQELTVEEISRRLGYEVKVVKG